MDLFQAFLPSDDLALPCCKSTAFCCSDCSYRYDNQQLGTDRCHSYTYSLNRYKDVLGGKQKMKKALKITGVVLASLFLLCALFAVINQLGENEMNAYIDTDRKSVV